MLKIIILFKSFVVHINMTASQPLTDSLFMIWSPVIFFWKTLLKSTVFAVALLTLSTT